MAADKNIQIKKHNGVDWDSLYPNTKAALVKLADNRTVETAITSVETNVAGKAVQADIDTAITNIKNGVATNLDTLKKIATAINNDAAFNTTITTALSGKADATATTTSLGLKVDKIAGKGLSTNDFTTAQQTKLNATDTISTSATAPTGAAQTTLWFQEV
jgi:hypothetical protein